MHYAKELQRELKLERIYSVAMRVAMRELKGYLSSDKFRTDTTVQVSDVMRRLYEVERYADTCREEQDQRETADMEFPRFS